MNKHEQLVCEICAMIEKYGAKKFADGMLKWYGYKELKEKGDLEEIEKLINRR